ncbi:transglycosylase family protein [Streptomyces sp. NPDC059853]|uniref:transglycosylase family protein n=1 Tax=Streptomyces sp. NPDC059853 TaxID=3346973 RepID=UPI003653454D
MRSGTGRHRRPKQPPAFVVAAGVTGAGIALPLLGTASANAVTPETWDATAACESGGVWTANTGNGYYGGLQIPLAQWEAHGGTDFAERPDLASRAQQITVAERMLAAQGKSAFPSCALPTGLWQEFRADARQTPETEDAGDARGSGGGAATDAGTDASGGTGSGIGETAPAERTGDSATGSGSGTGTSADTPDGPAADEKTGQGTGKPADSATGAQDGAPADEEGTGRHRGEAADEQDGRAGENADGSGRHAERPADRAGERTDADADEAGEAASPEAAEETTAAGSYEVISGDTLSRIADTLTVDGGWPALYAANESVIGDNPDHIVPGIELELGAKTD